MKKFGAILYLLCASVLSLWCVARFIGPELPTFAMTEPPKRVELLFVGDVMVHSPQLTVAKQDNNYDFKGSFKYVKPIFEAADCVIANLETTLTTTPPYSGYPCFKSPASLADALADTGVDIAVTANNHSLDGGKNGVKNTLEILRNRGILAVGTTVESALRMEINGVKFALLAYTYGTNGIPIPEGVTVHKIDTLQMHRDLEKCADVDCRIVFLHWGAEYSRRANREQRELANFLHRAGCQVVVGSHPHTIQGAECSQNEVTVYSLGNFVSNQRMRYSDGGIMAKVVVEKGDGACQFWLDILPVWVRRWDYAVIPQSVANSVRMSAEDRDACNLFFEDTRTLFTKR